MTAVDLARWRDQAVWLKAYAEEVQAELLEVTADRNALRREVQRLTEILETENTEVTA